MRFPLRWRILILTVLPLVTLAVAALWIVNRTVSRQVHASIQDDLRRSSAVFENMLASRARALSIEAEVIAQDPKFFSVLTLPGGADDPQLRATVAGVARDFAAITGADVFEVLDRQGRGVASVGRGSLTPGTRRSLAPPALAGRPSSDVVLEGDAHYQVCVMPVLAGGRVVGLLVLGLRIGREMAEQLRGFTRSEVTFFAGRTPTISTLERPADLEALQRVLPAPGRAPGPQRGGSLFEVRGPDDKYLTLWRAIPQASHEGAHGYTMQRSLSAETAFLVSIRWSLLQLGVLAVLCSVLAGFLISERILAPVRRLVRGAEEMERGNYEFQLEVRSHDEIGYLASRFDDMRQRQRAYVRNLQDVARLKSEFISVASHELRTPISIIKGFQELMAQGALGPLSPQQGEALKAIRRSTETLGTIAENATRMAQIEGAHLELHRETASVPEILEQAVAGALEMGGDRRVSIVTDIAADAREATVDPERVRVAVTHLISNAIRFTPDDGRVSLSARREEGDLVLAVSDTGVGISAERRETLFDRALLVRDSLNHHSSSTLEFNSRGLGLGLSIARGIAEAHGGTLSVDSVEGRGSTFVLRIPEPDRSERRAA